jgi:GntR family transcriptional regulator
VIFPGARKVRSYRDLAALLRAQITSGQLQPGAALPSERDLGQTYDLGRHTVRRAIEELAKAGLIDVRHGYGSVVRERPLDDALEPLDPEPGSSITTRMPSPEEAEEFGIGAGVPVFVVVAPSGAGDVYPGDRYRLVWPT